MQIVQKRFLAGAQTLRLVGEEVQVAIRDANGRREYSVELGELSTKTARFANRAVAWIITGTFFGLVWLGISILLIVKLWGFPGDLVPALALSGVLPGILVLMTWKGYRDRAHDFTGFYWRNGSGLAFGVWHNRAGRNEQDQFIAALKAEIDKHAPLDPTSNTGDFTAQLLQLEGLRKRGILTDSEFAAAKGRVLDGAGESPRIGFHTA